MAGFWGSIIGALLGGAVAIVAGLWGARWSAQYAALHQRAAQIHDTLVVLYADVYADIAKSEQEILHLTEPMMKMHGTGPDRATIGGRIMMLSPKAVQTAWAAYLADFDYLREYVNGATNFANGGLLSADDKQIAGCEGSIAALKQAVQDHLDGRAGPSATNK
jgi:hypothetical protein